MAFYRQGQNLKSIYLSDPTVLEQFIGSSLFISGRNNNGQIGNNSTTNVTSPVQTVALGVTWKLVAGGGDFSAGIKTDGTLWMWGSNTNGQLGDNTNTNRSSPVQEVTASTNWRAVACGKQVTGAIKTDGSLWMWGNNSYGMTGLGSASGNTVSPTQLGTEYNWKQVSAGYLHVGAVRTDGTLWMWGNNGIGQLGNNSSGTTTNVSPIQVPGTTWNSLACGNAFTGAIKTDGSLWLWGYNGYGGLGDNTSVAKSSPVQTVAGGTNWKSVTAGYYFTAAIKTDGTLWLWGQNSFGQLGGAAGSTSSPVQTVSAGNNWKYVACHSQSYSTTAIKTDGTLWMWGWNHYGELGLAAYTTSSPVQCWGSGTNWKLVAAGHYCVIAVTYTDQQNN